MAFPLLNNFLNWLLNINPALSILFISFILSLIITLVNKFLTNQKLMKEIREEQIKLQKEIRTEKNNPKKLSKINTRLMEINFKYMNESMKATLFTLIPFWLVFAWLNSHMGYYPIQPNTTFSITVEFEETAKGNAEIILNNNLKLINDESNIKEVKKTISWQILALEKGIQKIQINYKNKTYEKEVLITTQREYLPIETNFKKCFLFSCNTDGLNKIIINQEKIIPLKNVPILGSIPWINGFGWLGTYLLFSIFFTILLRKLLNVY
ncbi:MAG: EMC3/TMCO1 family protein [Candidatus Woesearchaeota archaeon]